SARCRTNGSLVIETQPRSRRGFLLRAAAGVFGPDHFFFDSSLTWTHVPTTSYLTRPSGTMGSVRVSNCRSAIRQRCCVANVSVATVPDGVPLVAIVKITSAHMLCPFVVVVRLIMRQ